MKTWFSKLVFSLLLLVSLFTIAGCLPTISQASGYLDNRKLWNTHAIVNYEYTYQYSENAVVVDNATISVVNDAVTAPAISPTQRDYKTITELFDEVSMLLVSRGILITVTYDTQYGFPIKIEAKPSFPDLSQFYPVLQFPAPVTTIIEVSNFVPL